MKFRYYITDLHEGHIVGTDDEEKARELSTSEDYFVLDASTGEWMNIDGRTPVEPMPD